MPLRTVNPSGPSSALGIKNFHQFFWQLFNVRDISVCRWVTTCSSHTTNKWTIACLNNLQIQQLRTKLRYVCGTHHSLHQPHKEWTRLEASSKQENWHSHIQPDNTCTEHMEPLVFGLLEKEFHKRNYCNCTLHHGNFLPFHSTSWEKVKNQIYKKWCFYVPFTTVRANNGSNIVRFAYVKPWITYKDQLTIGLTFC